MLTIKGTTVEQITVNFLNDSGITLNGTALALAIKDATWRKRTGGRAGLRNFLRDLKIVAQSGNYPGNS